LALRPWQGGWKIQVWDSGVGIAQQHHQAVFTDFFRVAQHVGTQDSFGLGLAIVDKLAQRMGAIVSLRSIPGRGSCFELTLPRAAN
jgi:signal transduction histidine kinase